MCGLHPVRCTPYDLRGLRHVRRICFDIPLGRSATREARTDPRAPSDYRLDNRYSGTKISWTSSDFWQSFNMRDKRKYHKFPDRAGLDMIDARMWPQPHRIMIIIIPIIIIIITVPPLRSFWVVSKSARENRIRTWQLTLGDPQIDHCDAGSPLQMPNRPRFFYAEADIGKCDRSIKIPTSPFMWLT